MYIMKISKHYDNVANLHCFPICDDIGLFSPCALFQVNITSRKVLQFPFNRNITSLCLGKVWFLEKNTLLLLATIPAISVKYGVGLSEFYHQNICKSISQSSLV